MSWRIILITKPCKLSTKNKQLVYTLENEEELTVPLDDITSIILDTKEVIITGFLLSELSEYNISLITTNSSHIPNGINLPYMKYYKNFETAFLQNEWTEPFKKRLWQKIIKQKIKNQAFVIKTINKEAYKYLIETSKNILSGDESFLEGISARKYFENFYPNFRRSEESKVNSALDYGYSIIRSLLAKNIAALGFIPCFGLHHCNKLNAFNLVDDLIEPFRPFVDFNVKNMFIEDSYNTTLNKEEREKLIRIIFQEIKYGEKKYSILYTTQLLIENLLLISKDKDTKKFILPEFSTDLL